MTTALILLSTYNGERFLAEQIESILAQTHTDWTLLIRDDGSSDATRDIIQEYCAKDPRIIFNNDSLGNLGSCGSFSALMSLAVPRDEPYVFFCDQDDVWLPEKLKLTLDELRMLEERWPSTPCLVHTDLHVVDESLNTIHPSFLKHEGLRRNPSEPIKTLLINNYVTGCTVGMNRALLEIATPVPPDAFMHDWWSALCAAAMGHIGFVDQATILYRQHGRNAIGSSGFFTKVKELKQWKRMLQRRRQNLIRCFNQADDLFEKLPKTNPHSSMIGKFLTVPTLPKLKRYHAALKLNLRPASTLRKAVFLLFLSKL